MTRTHTQQTRRKMSESAIRRWNNLPTSASDVVEFKRNSYFYHETSAIDKLIPQIVHIPLSQPDISFEYVPLSDTMVDDFQFEFESEDTNTELTSQLNSILTKRENFIITRLFGLDGEEPSTQTEISELLDLTRDRISSIRTKALKKLRDNLNVGQL
jgi:DNA-directed RNA polymerase specialized sigma subunit